jgi:elongation factor G
VAVVGSRWIGQDDARREPSHARGRDEPSGKVDDGTSILDTDPEEHKRRITINVAIASFMNDGTKLNLLDTPGFADFAGDQRAALRVADAAVVVIDGSAGIQVGTTLVWSELDKAQTPRVVALTRLDRENADFDKVLAQLRAAYGIRVVPLHVPVGHQQDISATIDLLHGTVLKGPKDKPAEMDQADKERVGSYRQQLVEAIVETNEELLTRYPRRQRRCRYDELRDALHAAVREGKRSSRVVATSVVQETVGITALLNTIREMLPSPGERYVGHRQVSRGRRDGAQDRSRARVLRVRVQDTR